MFAFCWEFWQKRFHIILLKKAALSETHPLNTVETPGWNAIGQEPQVESNFKISSTRCLSINKKSNDDQNMSEMPSNNLYFTVVRLHCQVLTSRVYCTYISYHTSLYIPRVLLKFLMHHFVPLHFAILEVELAIKFLLILRISSVPLWNVILQKWLFF